MLATCFSTTFGVMNSAAAIAAFERPCATRASTSFSLGVSAGSRWRRSRTDTTSGSSTVPPAATRSSASTKSPTSATRSLSRYPTPDGASASSDDAAAASMYWEKTSTPTAGNLRRTSAAIRSPSSL
jgi:hypothetical protein